MAAELDLLLEAGDADFEELVEVARDDAEEAQALEQRHAARRRPGQNAPVEGEQRELPVEEMLGGEVRQLPCRGTCQRLLCSN
jgi:hypothetical protein